MVGSETGVSTKLLSTCAETLQCYLTLLAFYLHLCASGVSLSKLKSHPIRKRLLFLRESTQELHALGIVETADEDSISLSTENVENASPFELSSSPSIFSDQGSFNEEIKPGMNNSRETKAIPNLLPEPVFNSNKQMSRRTGNMIEESTYFGDPLKLERLDAEDKRLRKKSLRFHTGRIDSLSHHHSNTRLDRGGDDDITYLQQSDGGLSILRREGASPSFSHLAGNKRQRPQHTDLSSDEEKVGDYYESLKRRKSASKEKDKETYELEQDMKR
jgi:U3 small nucleolar RNA-associated protein 3